MVDTVLAAPASEGIHSVDNALRVLQLFRERDTVGVLEIARLLAIGRATAHRLVTTLLARDFLVQDPSSRAYLPGPALCELTMAIEGIHDGRSESRPYLRELASQLGETVQLVSLRGHRTIVLEVAESSRALRVGAEEGSTLPATMSAPGQVLLSQTSADRLEETLTGALNVSAESMRTWGGVLAEVRSRGFAVGISPVDPDVLEVAVSVDGYIAGQHVALGVVAPRGRVRGGDDRQVIVEAALETAGRMAREVAIPERP